MGKSGNADSGDIGGLGFTDPPDHTRLRKLLTPEFTMRRLARLKPAIDRIIGDQLDETERLGADGQPVDLAQTFAFPVPFLVICELLGLPVEEREKFRGMASARFDVTGGGVGTVGAVAGSRQFLFEETARQRLDPGPGLIGQIIREHGDEITDFDLAGLADGAFTGGLETSASMLALGTAVLLERRDVWDRLIAEDDTVGPIVDELLRYLAVVQISFPRFAKHDVVLGGQRIKKGAVLLAHLPAANRDPRAYHGGGFDHSTGDGLPPGLRPRLPPLRGRRAGPDGAAGGVPRPGPPVPPPHPGGRPQRAEVPRPLDRVRRRGAAGAPRRPLNTDSSASARAAKTRIRPLTNRCREGGAEWKSSCGRANRSRSRAISAPWWTCSSTRVRTWSPAAICRSGRCVGRSSARSSSVASVSQVVIGTRLWRHSVRADSAVCGTTRSRKVSVPSPNAWFQ